MKCLPQKVVEVAEEGLLTMLGQQVEIWCGNYIYTGKLVGVNDKCIKLENPAVVYETGELKTKTYKDCQPTGRPFGYVFIQWMEFAELAK